MTTATQTTPDRVGFGLVSAGRERAGPGVDPFGGVCSGGSPPGVTGSDVMIDQFLSVHFNSPLLRPAARNGGPAQRGCFAWATVQAVSDSLEDRYDYLRSFLLAAWRG
ncbi:hypothetical protein ACTAQJ_06110 [Arthrobacter sp. alpha11c]